MKAITFLAILAGGIFAAIQIGLYVQSKVAKGEYKFLKGYSDEDARRFRDAIDDYIVELGEDCAEHNYSVDSLNGWFPSQKIKMEFNFDKSDGDIECKDPRTGVIHFTENLDDWVYEKYGD